MKRIVLKACAYNPEDRYDSASEMLEDLENLVIYSNKRSKEEQKNPKSAEVKAEIPEVPEKPVEKMEPKQEEKKQGKKAKKEKKNADASDIEADKNNKPHETVSHELNEQPAVPVNTEAEIKKSVKENKKKHMPGFIGSLYGTIMGAMVWYFVDKYTGFGFITALVIGVLSIKGYEVFEGTLDKKGIIFSSIISVLGAVVAALLSIARYIYFDGHEFLAFAQILSVIFTFFKGTYSFLITRNLVIGIALTVIGVFLSVNAYKNGKKIVKDGSVLSGIVGASAGALLGIVVWLLIDFIVPIGPVCGILIGYFSVKGAQLLGNKLDSKTVIICSVITFLAVYLSNYYGWILTYATYSSEYYVSVFETIEEVKDTLGYSKYINVFAFEVITGVLLGLLSIIAMLIYHSAPYKESSNKLKKGVCGALLGSFIGGLVFVFMQSDFFVLIGGVLIGLFGIKGYEMMGGETNRLGDVVCFESVTLMTYLSNLIFEFVSAKFGRGYLSSYSIFTFVKHLRIIADKALFSGVPMLIITMALAYVTVFAVILIRDRKNGKKLNINNLIK